MARITTTEQVLTQKFEEVIGQFDFETVARVFALMGWEYDADDDVGAPVRPSVWERLSGATSSKGSRGIPNVETLQALARRLFEHAIRDIGLWTDRRSEVFVSSGRLEVRVSPSSVSLSFSPIKSSTYKEGRYWV